MPVIRAAHELGLYVITCDYLPHNCAHQFSDEYYNASIIDKEAVLKAAIELKADGIMSFACDPGVTTAAYVAERLGLPHSGSYESVAILQDKGRFRSFLSEHGFKVPTARSFSSFDELKELKDIFHWPVIVKPVDSAGSKGVTRVDDSDRLKAAFDYAINHSFQKKVIVEDFLEKRGASSDTDSFSVNGELKFVSFNAQHFDVNAINPYTPAAYSWPATISKTHQKELKDELQRLLKLLNMKTSIYNIETRECTNGNAYIMECTPRGGGNRLAEILNYATGVDLIKGAVQAAVGMPISEIEQRPYDGYWIEIVLHSDQAGEFKEVWVSDDIRDNIFEKQVLMKDGDKVGGFEAANDALGTLILRFDRKEDSEEVLRDIDRYARVILA